MSQKWQPGWSRVEKIEGGGRYPLQLNRFHNGLEELLIPSLTELANRLRYISYYCWAIGDIRKTNQNLSYQEFVSSFWRMENALAVGLHLLKPKYPYNGNNNPNVRETVTQSICDLNFQLMQSNRFGAFGLYYVGTTQNLGLAEVDENGIYALTDPGKRLYQIYDAYLQSQNSRYYVEYKNQDKVNADVLLEWGKVNDLINIRENKCEKERNFYKSILFYLDKKNVSGFRRQTFSLFFEVIKQCRSKEGLFNEVIIKTTNYYGSFYDQNKNVHSFELPKNLDDAYYYWNIYEGHGYFRGWLLRYFQVFLEFLKSRADGASIDDFFESFDKNNFNSVVSTLCGNANDYYNGSMDLIFKLFTHQAELDSPISEESILTGSENASNSELLAKFLLTMVAIMVRFESRRKDEAYLFLQNQRLGDLWFDRLFSIPSIKSLPVYEFLQFCLKNFIIQQHDRVMYEKRDLRRCWFTKEQNKYFFQAEINPIWRPAKFQTIMNFVEDMGLVKKVDESYLLTTDGLDLYAQLKKEYL